MEILIAVGASAIAAFWVGLVVSKRSIKQLQRENTRGEMTCRELEKKIHELEAGHLKEKNSTELDRIEQSKALRERHHQEGFELGAASSMKDHQVELANLKAEHREQLSVAIAEAERTGRNAARLELESQTKAFSVCISPYVRIEKDDGLIWDEHKSYTGYQYQLLINGIPAFQPHVVIERTEELKSVDKEMVAELVKLAGQSVEKAVEIYLSGASEGALKLGSEVIEHVTI